MKTIAYLRVSTGGQDLDSQRLAILDYAHRHRFHVDDFLEVTVSPRKTLKGLGVDRLCAGMQAGDLLLVSELSRLGRSVGQIIQIVDDLVKNQIRLVAIKEDIRLDGRQDIQSKVMVTLFGLFAEIERDLISERTREGLAAAKAKAKGHLAGRPKGSLGQSRLDGREAEIKTLLGKQVSKASIAKIMDVSRSTLLHFIRSRALDKA
ncbi:DNA-invertase hin [Myxococcaceae bacterium]|nr:DNA-invertase hin [Myxococcaceae bacterium]